MIYSEAIRVRYSEVGEDGLLTPVALVNYLQDITMFHSEVFSELKLCTSPYDFKGGIGLRNCWI